jgi:Tol biopolymer transport system component
MERMVKLFFGLFALPIFIQAAFAQTVKMPFASEKPVPEPRIFAPGVISTGDYESEPQFSPDGKTFYFIKSTPDFNFWTIVFSRFERGRWSQPAVAPFSGRFCDADPFITPDGKRLFFISRRPVDARISPNTDGKLDIYVMEKTAAGWSEPKNLGTPVNSEASEFFPTLTNNGTLYFGSGRAGGKGGIDLYRARFADGKFQAPENLGDAINTPFDEFEPFIAADESFLIFMAGGRADGLGGFDLYISYNRCGQWTKAQNLGAPINSAGDELGGKISPDGKYFFWSSNRSAIINPRPKPQTYIELMRDYASPQNGLGDIYYIDSSVLKIGQVSGRQD